MNDFVSQLRGEWAHASLTAVFAGLAYLLRRDIQRRDERLAKIEADIANAKTTLATYREWYRDLRGAVRNCETALRIEHYPFTD